LVVYPHDNSTSDFEFSYGLVGVITPPSQEVKEEEELENLKQIKENIDIAYAVSITAISLAVALAVGVCCACRKNKNQVNILTEDEKGVESGQHLATISPRPPNNGIETSMHLDEMEDEPNPGMNIITKDEN
jgi:hypothetical protein